jgi:hypothetical protein
MPLAVPGLKRGVSAPVSGKEVVAAAKSAVAAVDAMAGGGGGGGGRAGGSAGGRAGGSAYVPRRVREAQLQALQVRDTLTTL